MNRQTLQTDNDNIWLSGARKIPSPNCDDRPANTGIDLLVIHGISLPPGEYGGDYIDQLFTNKLDPRAHPYFAGLLHASVSAHLLIKRCGEITQYVPFNQRAWHAGASLYKGREQCNDFSIGIELEGCDTENYTDVQYVRLAEVTRIICARWQNITKDRIVGHCDIAPGRKTDPGPAFDKQHYFSLIKL